MKEQIRDVQTQVNKTDSKVDNLNVDVVRMKGEIGEIKTMVKTYHEK